MLGDFGNISDNAGAQLTVDGDEGEVVLANAVVPTLLLKGDNDKQYARGTHNQVLCLTEPFIRLHGQPDSKML